VAGLEIPSPFDVEAFCAAVGRARGREILRLGRPLPEGLYGLWFSTPARDYVVHESRTSALHQVHITLHELSHLLCGHHAAPVMDDELSRLLMPDLDPGLVRRVLARTRYSDVEEQEAELVASLIVEQVSTCQPDPAWPVTPGPPGTDEVISRLVRVLSPHALAERD
jgi:hypothetical protein